MHFSAIDPHQIPTRLLLEADPSLTSIQSYLDNAWGFIAQDSRHNVLAACILKQTRADTAELFNIAVWPEYQAQGIGAQLLSYALDKMAEKNIRHIELGTGTFGHQLTFYQRLGFRVQAVVKNHFLNHYPEPLFEHGIQHRDMLRLSLDL